MLQERFLDGVKLVAVAQAFDGDDVLAGDVLEGTEQDRTACWSTTTVQAPHSPSPQPNLCREAEIRTQHP